MSIVNYTTPWKTQEDKFYFINDLKERSRQYIETGAFDYYTSGSESENVFKEQELAYTRILFVPRMLRDVTSVNTKTTVFGQELRFPLLIAPMAAQQLCGYDGELSMSSAAEKHGIGYVLSTLSTHSVQDVAQSRKSTNNLFFQLYYQKSREANTLLVREAEKWGYKGICVTCDVPVHGRRIAAEKSSFSLTNLPNVEKLRVALENSQENKEQDSGKSEQQKKDEMVSKSRDTVMVWEDISWLKSITDLPIIAKGILNEEDAELAIRYGVDGIMVSNHGGRQLDYAIATINALPAIAKQVRGRVPIVVDGGVRKGTDILKALALGADAVMIGRPFLYALACGGEDFVQRSIDLLRTELEISMKLCGVRSIQEARSIKLVSDLNEVIQPQGISYEGLSKL